MATHSSILACRIPMERGAWQAMVQGLINSWTRLSNLAKDSMLSISGLGTKIFASGVVWQKKKSVAVTLPQGIWSTVKSTEIIPEHLFLTSSEVSLTLKTNWHKGQSSLPASQARRPRKKANSYLVYFLYLVPFSLLGWSWASSVGNHWSSRQRSHYILFTFLSLWFLKFHI